MFRFCASCAVREGTHHHMRRATPHIAHNRLFFSSWADWFARPAYAAEPSSHRPTRGLPSYTARVIQPDVRAGPGTDPATSAEVCEVESGIFASWVPDALSYHAPPGMREQPLRKSNMQGIAETKSFSDTDAAPAGEAVTNTKTMPTTFGSEAATLAGAEEDVEVGSRKITSGPHCESSPNCSGSNHKGNRGSFFYGPLQTFETSPVFEWLGCLWQWRPIEVQHAGRPLLSPPKTHSNQRLDNVGEEEDEPLLEKWSSSTATAAASTADRHFYMVPFLLLPTNEVVSGRPCLHASLRDAVLARHARLHSQSCPTPHAIPPSAALWRLTAATAVGDLPLVITSYHDSQHLAVFQKQERQLTEKARGCDYAMAAPEPLTPPPAETWEAVTQRSTSRGRPYVRVYRTDGSVDAGVGNTDTAATAAVPLPMTRRNVVGGGLAELILAMDRYAALLARDEVTLSAACWAALCDTKSWWVVQQLRLTPVQVERELVAATAAHRRWQQRAVALHKTMVGKSSHGIRFDDYPHLARWG